MISFKCDICKKEVPTIETLILYRQRIDYCEECESKANRMKRAMKNSINYYSEMIDKDLRDAEKTIMSRRY